MSVQYTSHGQHVQLTKAKSVKVLNIIMHHRDKPMSIARNNHNQLWNYLSRRLDQTLRIDCDLLMSLPAGSSILLSLK